jgi:hypothetical protein
MLAIAALHSMAQENGFAISVDIPPWKYMGPSPASGTCPPNQD